MAQEGFTQGKDNDIQQNETYEKIIKPIKRGGPYSKSDTQTRRSEVRRLHFEYGYSGRKISSMMNINRNTINRDLDYWYSNILQDVNYLNPIKSIRLRIEQLHTQQTRLRERLDDAKNSSEKISLERLLFDVTSKIIATLQRISTGEAMVVRKAENSLNKFFEEKHLTQRVISQFDVQTVSEEAQKEIHKIIAEDLKRFN